MLRDPFPNDLLGFRRGVSDQEVVGKWKDNAYVRGIPLATIKKFGNGEVGLIDFYDGNKGMVDDFKDILDEEINGLVICGPAGIGKTTLSCLVAMGMWVKSRVSYFRAGMSAICSALYDDNTSEELVEKLATSVLLIIDPIDAIWYGDLRSLGILGGILDERASSSNLQTIGLVDSVSLDNVGEHGIYILNKISASRPYRFCEIDAGAAIDFGDWGE